MDKVICDICGTSYPASATQCPICGCEKPADPQVDTEAVAENEEIGYKPVRGGRFSNANVRKRNAGKKELPRVVAPVKPAKEAEVKPRKSAAAAPAAKETSIAQKQAAQAPVRRKPNKEKQERSTNIILAVIALVLVLAIVLLFLFYSPYYSL